MNKYIGNRYVPVIDGEWVKTKAYEPLTVVTYQGASYTSKTYIPSGIEITNTTYWVLSANYNAQIEAYRNELVKYKENRSTTVNVRDLGILGDGVTDVTAALQAAMNDCESIYFPAGTYLINGVTIPSTVRHIYGDGVNTVLMQATNSSPNLLTINSNNCIVENLLINTGGATTSFPIFVNGGEFNVVRNITIAACENIAIYALECKNLIIDSCSILSWKQGGIIGYKCYDSIITKSTVRYTSGLSTAVHGIQFSGGARNEINSNNITGAHEFGCNLYLESDSIISKNRIRNTTKEAINVQDSSNCQVIDNNVSWDTITSGIDFGISLYGSDGFELKNCVVANNIVHNSNKSGIALADYCSGNTVSNNILINGNGEQLADGAGIVLYGSPTYNKVIGNTIKNQDTSYFACGVKEDGAASNYNTISNNTAENITTTVKRVGKYTLVSNNQPSQWTPFITSLTTTAGAIGAYTSNTSKYMLDGNKCYVQFDITITDNGTGDGGIKIQLPFENTSDRECSLNGIEIAISGRMLSCQVAENKIIVRDYTNQYAGGANARITVQGWYAIM